MHRTGGFTLIELMIVVMIIAILAAVGYPAYQSQMEKGHLSEGRAALTQFASQLERCFSRFGEYDDSNCSAYTTANNDNYYSENKTYKITLSSISDNSFTAEAVREKATDLNNCGNLTLTQTGKKGVTSGASKSADQCW